MLAMSQTFLHTVHFGCVLQEKCLGAVWPQQLLLPRAPSPPGSTPGSTVAALTVRLTARCSAGTQPSRRVAVRLPPSLAVLPAGDVVD